MDQLRLSLKRCLLCGESGSQNEDNSKISKLDGIVGGVNCVSLERQLEKMFILLKVLEVPVNWCEGTLRGKGGGDGGRENCESNPDSWFALCDKCIEGNVGRAWRAYQNILKWQTRMLSVKLQILEGMRRSILKNNNRKNKRGLEGSGGSQVDIEIKRYLFPDLFAKKVEAVPAKQEVDYAEDFEGDKAYQVTAEEEEDQCPPKKRRPLKYEDNIENEEEEDNHHEIIDKPEDDDSDYQPDNIAEDVNVKMDENFENDNLDEGDDDDDKIEDKPIKTIPPRRPRRKPGDPPRRRGRPPKKLESVPLQVNPVLKKGRPRLPDHLRKPSFRHPDHYYSHYYGTLRQKRFHWKVCGDCPAKYAYQEDFDAHLECHEKRKQGQRLSTELDCDKCPFLARDIQELELHLKRKHKIGCSEEAKGPPKYYKCPRCPFKTLRWKVLKWHCLKDHPEVPLEDYGDLFILKCKICGQSFENLQRFTRHKNSMHPKKGDGEEEGGGGPVQCAECGVKFLSRALLGFHEKKEHRGKGVMGPLRYQCDECGMGFAYLGKLRRHLRCKHNGGGGPLREHVCDICGMDFREKRSLDKHFERFHNKKGGEGGLEGGGGKVNVFKCKYCEVTSGVKTFIKRHVMEEHKGEMAWKCDLCERRYMKKQGLEIHKKLNHGGRRWFCEWCGKGFANEVYMRDHQKKYCKFIGVGEGGKGEKAGDLNLDLSGGGEN